MKKELTFFEAVRLVLAMLVGFVVLLGTSEVGSGLMPEPEGMIEFVVALVLIRLLPPFVAILIACVLPSWRYKTIAGTVMLMATTVWIIIELFPSVSHVLDLVVVLVLLSTGMSGALAAVLFWQRLKKRHLARSKSNATTPQPMQKRPRTSSFLLGLSLASIPATYLTIIVSAFLVVGYSALLVLILLELPRFPVVLIIAAVLAPIVAGWAALRAVGAILRPRPAFQLACLLDMSSGP
jgi:hypothetical protein